MTRGALARFFAYWIGAAVVGYFVIVLPIVLLTGLSGGGAMLLGMAVGGLTPAIGFYRSRRVADWIGLYR